MTRELLSFGYHLVELYNLQLNQNWEALKYKFCERNGWLIFLEDQCFEPFLKFTSGFHSSQRETIRTKYYRLFRTRQVSALLYALLESRNSFVRFSIFHFLTLSKMNKADSLATYKVGLLQPTSFPTANVVRGLVVVFCFPCFLFSGFWWTIKLQKSFMVFCLFCRFANLFHLRHKTLVPSADYLV